MMPARLSVSRDAMQRCWLVSAFVVLLDYPE